MNEAYTGRTLSKNTDKRLDLRKYTIFILAIGMFIFLSASTQNFFSYENIYSIILDISIQFFVIIGFTFLLIMGEIDMSVGAMYGFSGAFAGYLAAILKLPFAASFVLTLLLCAGIGLVTGTVVVRFRVNSMMVTIGMMTALQGLKAVFIDKLTARIFTGDFKDFLRFKIFGVHWVIIAFIVLVVVLEIFLQWSSLFRKLYYVGQNLETARIHGIKSDRIKMSMFVLSAFTAAIGGVMAASRVSHAAATAGDGLEFTMITAAVLGGASLFGGKGGILRSAIGLFFLAMISNGMISYAIDPYVQQIVLGMILIIAVTMDIVFNTQNRRS
jgi:ribose transport system permease protein